MVDKHIRVKENKILSLVIGKTDSVLRKIKRRLQSFVINKRRNDAYQSQRLSEISGIKREMTAVSRLFITHDNNGGTKNYENNYIRECSDLIVLRRLRYEFMEDQFFKIEIYHDKNLQADKIWLLKLNEINEIFQYKYTEIVVNSLVTYQCYDEMIQQLIQYKKTNITCEIKYLVHDFHGICPNVNLFHDGRYCDLECEKEKCVLYVGKRNIDISQWRKLWNQFFGIIDEIRCFSNSSKELVERVYPQISETKYKVIPHDTSYCESIPIPNIDNLSLCIGIVGAIISEQKGKEVVKHILRKFGSRIPIRMIGTTKWTYFVFGKKIKYLGTYKREELRDILIREKVSLVIFPSLCPETFSYLVSELIALEVPIICFDCGAQAEKVSNYKKGIVCKNKEEMLDILEEVTCYNE